MTQAITDLKLLLHCCCGPCAEFPLWDYRQKGVRPTLFFGNPNIHPQEEWQHRWEGIYRVSQLQGLHLLTSLEWDEKSWLERGESADRCLFCYEHRLEQTALQALRNGFNAFTTTLLVSPYQNREAILDAGRRLAEKTGLLFLEEDWREGYRAGQEMARQHGLYRQHYCGCLFSRKVSSEERKIQQEQAAYRPLEDTPKPIPEKV